MDEQKVMELARRWRDLHAVVVAARMRKAGLQHELDGIDGTIEDAQRAEADAKADLFAAIVRDEEVVSGV